MKPEVAKKYWLTIVAASVIGLVSSLIQTIERINYAEHPVTKLSCDINSIFSCSNVFSAWQSRVFGFSNSLVCMMFFGVTMGLALAAAYSNGLRRKLRLVFHFFSVFFLGFGAWYLWQSTYRIGYVCIFCLFCYSAVILMNWAWFRLHYQELFGKKHDDFVRRGGDIFLALLWTIVIAAMIIFHFWGR